MARNSYQYETSPRKLEPEYSPRKREPSRKSPAKKAPSKSTRKSKEYKEKEKEELEEKKKALKQHKRMYHKKIFAILGVFLILLAISYRNSLITEKFSKIQEKKSELSSIEKANGQMQVNIEGSMNLNNVEKAAGEKLGMQKLQNNQKVYVSLPKEDYTEAVMPEITESTNTNWFTNLINSIFK